MRKGLNITCLAMLLYTMIANGQSRVLLMYDSNGNRLSKATKGSSSIPTIIANKSKIVAGQPVSLFASGCNGTIQWSTGQTGSSISVSPTVTSQYSASCISPSCSTNGIAYTTVEVTDCIADILTATVNPNFIRYGIPITLSANGCKGTIQWSTGHIGNIISIKPYGNLNTVYATCIKENCPNNTISVVINAHAPCYTGAVLTTLKAGNWSDPTVWSCGQLPTLNNEVYLNHVIDVNVNGEAKNIIWGSGYLNYPNNSFISLPQN